MCLVSQPSTPKLQQPAEYAQQKAPDAGQARTDASQLATDRLRAGSQTILTSGSGVTDTASTSKKTLLGQ